MIYFDIETADWDEFVVGGIYDGKTQKFLAVWDETNFFEELQKYDKIYGWNTGLYDGIWYSKMAAKNNHRLDFLLAGSRAIKIIDTDAKLEIIDCMGMVPMGLDKAAKMMGKEGKDELDYSRIKELPRAKVESYLLQDLKSTQKAYEGVLELWDRENWLPALTLGASLWKTLQALVDMPSAKWRKPRDYNFSRKGYFGGRVCPAKTFSKRGVCLDIVSAYPYVMANHKLPLGEYFWSNGGNVKKYMNNHEGVVQAMVYSPPAHLPVLPVRTKKGGLAYPTGTFHGVWTTNELRYALTRGYILKETYAGIFWKSNSDCLQQMTKIGFAARERLGKDTQLGKFIKIYINCGYGKLGQRPDRWAVEMNPPRDTTLFCPGTRHVGECPTNTCCMHRCRGYCGRWEPLGNSTILFKKPVYRLSGCSHAQAAAYITAEVRCIWHRAAVLCGEDLAYGDTDSIFTEKIPTGLDIGKNLGQFDIECDYENLLIGGPKLYVCDTVKGTKIGSKGVNIKNKEEFIKYLYGHPVANNTGVWGIKTAARKGLFIRKVQNRVCRKPYSHGNRIPTGDNKTRAPNIEELQWL